MGHANDLKPSERGLAAGEFLIDYTPPRQTRLQGRHTLRVAICDHRTRTEELDLLVEEVLKLSRELA